MDLSFQSLAASGLGAFVILAAYQYYLHLRYKRIEDKIDIILEKMK